ncbi:MAG: hypothetical protein RSA66_09285 [Muribaculaceae bacterium]
MKNQIGETGILLMEKLNPSFGILVSWSTKLIAVMPTIIDYIQQYGKYVMYASTVVLAYVAGQKLQLLWAKLVNANKAKGIALENLSTIAKLKNIAIDKISIILLNARAIAQAALNVAIGIFSLNMAKAKQGMIAMNIVLKANPWGALLAVIVAVAGAIYLLATRTSRLTETQKTLNKIKEEASAKLVDEKTKIDILVAAAKNEKLSLEERHKAIDGLNKIIPGYNAQLDDTTGKYKENKKALDQYLNSLAKKYELEGAKETLTNIGAELSRLYAKNRKNVKARDSAKSIEEISNTPKPVISMGASMPSQAQASMYNSGEFQAYNSEIRETNRLIEEQKDIRKAILDIYGIDMQKQAIADTTKPVEEKCSTCGKHPCVCKKELTDEEKKAIEKKAKEREKAKREAEAEAKKEITNALNNEKSTYELAIATNNAEISQGKKTYLKYVEDKYNIEVAYIGKRKKVYEDRNAKESDEYKTLLAQELELKTKHAEEIKKLNIEELDKQQQAQEDELLSQCYDVNNKLYANERARNEGLHRINVTYLAKKRDTYAMGAKEWIDIQNQIDNAENSEMLRKQKENSELIAEWRQNYTRLDSSRKMEMELAILDEMYKKGLIKEVEFQKIKKGIIAKYKAEDKDKNRSDDPFVDNILKLTNAIDNVSTKGLGLADIFANIGDAASAGFAIAGSALQQYAQYSQACADLEIAQTEKKYDKLIKGAGKNTKQKEKLEEQKEKDINRIKAKYSAQAEKIEIAQAIAATALSAIYAYQSGLQAGGPFGLILAPIAAGMAIAAGMLQIATIRKQHAAESAGYYSGGYTERDANNNKAVGSVHANEFVANHHAVANPNIRPILSLIDNAQRNNTIGSLTARDVSNAIGQGAILATSTGVVTNNSNIVDNTNAGLAIVSGVVSSSSDAINRLNKKLDEGIETYMIMDGERGFDTKYKHFQKLQQNYKR